MDLYQITKSGLKAVEKSTFVIIEYKEGSSYSVVDRSYSYPSKMLENKHNEKLMSAK